MNNEAHDNRMEALMHKYAFTDLKPADKAYVLTHMDQETYSQTRQMIMGMAALEAPPLTQSIAQSKAAIKQQLGTRLRPPQPLLLRIMATSIPLWCCVLASALASWATASYDRVTQKDTTESTMIVDSIQVVIDTMYLPQKTDTVYVIREVIKEVTLPTPIQEPASVPMAAAPLRADPSVEALPSLLYTNIDLQDLTQDQKLGRSVADDGDLMDLLTESRSDGLD